MFAEGKPPPEMKKGIERIMANPQLQEAMGQGMGIGHVGYCQVFSLSPCVDMELNAK